MTTPPSQRGPRKSGFPARSRYTLWYLLAAIMVLFLVQSLFSGAGVEEINYSEFRRMVREGRFEEVMISETKVIGVLRQEGAPEAGEEGAKARRPVQVRALRVEDEKLVELLEETGTPYKGRTEATWMREALMWLIPIGAIVIFWIFILRYMGRGSQVMSFGRSKARLYAEDEVKVTFEDAAGVDEAVEELKEVVDFLSQPQKYQRLGGTLPKGILLVGPPGTGKTLLARAVAGEAKVTFFSMNGSDFVEMFVGVGAARIRDLFSQAQEKAPCIIFIDELDALGKVRGASPIAGHDEREQTLNQLLAEMDGFESKKGVIILAATNRPEILDAALLRPGRFDRQVLVDRPDIRGREAIFRIHSRGVKMGPEVDLKVLAARTPGFVGSDIRNVVNEAALLAARKDKDQVDTADLEEAIERTVAGLEKRKRVISERERKILAYHESGHALVAESLEGADPVHKISIVQRGIAALGYTLQLPVEDRYILTQRELEDRLAVLFGGRASEILVFDEASTGAQNDLQRATELARSMVVDFGMSPLGPVAYRGERRPMFLEGIPGVPGEYSDETGREIDQAIREILESAMARAEKTLRDRREELDRVAEVLLEREVLRREEFVKVLAGEPLPPQDGEGEAGGAGEEAEPDEEPPVAAGG